MSDNCVKVKFVAQLIYIQTLEYTFKSKSHHSLALPAGVNNTKIINTLITYDMTIRVGLKKCW